MTTRWQTWAMVGLCLLLTACQSEEQRRTRAHDWCLQKWADTAVRLNPVYRPTPEEVKRGQDAFMRQCIANQGY
jgi:hypothetical protein